MKSETTLHCVPGVLCSFRARLKFQESDGLQLENFKLSLLLTDWLPVERNWYTTHAPGLSSILQNNTTTVNKQIPSRLPMVGLAVSYYEMWRNVRFVECK